MQAPDFMLITRPAQWSDCLQKLQDEPRLAMDLEANSMFAYRESVCLMQISTPAQDYIIDPLAELDLEPLGRLIADPAVEKIFHAAEYDLILMKRQYGWELHGLFDTMWAARILGLKRFGLAGLLEQFFDVHLNKRYQKSNWCQRPLTPDQLTYACFDTHYLFELRDVLAAQLEEQGRCEEAAVIFEEQTHIELSDNGFDPDDFWSINGAQDLSGQQQAVLKAIVIFRDAQARRRDQPLFKILSDRTLLEIAKRSPRTVHDLAAVHGMSKGQMRRYGHDLLDAVREGLKAKPPRFPQRRKRLPEDVLQRYERLHTWRKIRGRKRGVESDVIISRGALWDMAATNPSSISDLQQLESVGEWRAEVYGAEILDVLRGRSDQKSGRNSRS